MIWAHVSRLHWVCNDFNGIAGQVRVIKKMTYWEVIDTSDGRVLYKGKCDQTLDAMEVTACYLEEINGIKTKTSECPSKEEKTEVLNESESYY